MFNSKPLGITLIELLVVTAICAILAAIALTVYSRCREPAKYQSGREACRQIYIRVLAEYPEETPISQKLTSGNAYHRAIEKRNETENGQTEAVMSAYMEAQGDLYCR